MTDDTIPTGLAGLAAREALSSEDYRFAMSPGPYSGNYGAPCLPSLGEPCGNCHRCCRCEQHGGEVDQ